MSEQKQESAWQKFATQNPKTAKYTAYAAACAGAVITGAAGFIGVPAIFAEGASLATVATGFATGAGIGAQLSAAILLPVGGLVAGAEHIERRNQQQAQEKQAQQRKKSMANSMKQALRDKTWQPSAWRNFRQKMPITSSIVKYGAIGLGLAAGGALLFGGAAKVASVMRMTTALAVRFVVPALVLAAVTDTVVSAVKGRDDRSPKQKKRPKNNQAHDQGQAPHQAQKPQPTQKQTQNFQGAAVKQPKQTEQSQKAPEFSEKGPKLSLKPKGQNPKR